MPNFSPYANFGYLALKKETTAGSAVTPDTFVGLLSESIVPDYAITPVQTIAGDRERKVRSIPGRIEIDGDVEFYVEPKTIGHFLRSLFGAPTTQILTASVAFRHVFEVTDDPKTYTMDVQPGDAPWVHRFFGIHLKSLAFEPTDNLLKCTAGTSPRKAFINARVTEAVSSGTSLKVDQTSGLTTSDTILILQKEDGFTEVAEHTISAIPSETELTVNTISATIDEDDIVVIKRQSSSYDQDLEFTWHGGSEVSSGTDVDNTASENTEDFSLTFANETESRFFAGKEEAARFAGDVLTKGYFAEGSISKFYDNESKLDKLRKNIKVGLRVDFCGEDAIESNSAVKASSIWGATANGFKVEASTAGRAGNDINVTIAIASNDTLAASKSGNNILIELANTTSSKNTGTLIAAAVDALSGVDGTAEGTGAEEFTAAEDNTNLGFRSSNTNVVGRDASEESYLRFDLADIRIKPYFPSSSEDSILQEDIPFDVYKDTIGAQRKNWSTRIYLVNDVSAY